jgi:hypothetical protein
MLYDYTVPLFVRTWKNTYPYFLGTLFSEELLQRRDVVSLSYWKLYIPYRPRCFFAPLRGKLSGIVYKRGLIIAKLSIHKLARSPGYSTVLILYVNRQYRTCLTHMRVMPLYIPKGKSVLYIICFLASFDKYILFI